MSMAMARGGDGKELAGAEGAGTELPSPSPWKLLFSLRGEIPRDNIK
jgi:hypothetical protein